MMCEAEESANDPILEWMGFRARYSDLVRAGWRLNISARDDADVVGVTMTHPSFPGHNPHFTMNAYDFAHQSRWQLPSSLFLRAQRTGIGSYSIEQLLAEILRQQKARKSRPKKSPQHKKAQMINLIKITA
jgi:hypothetical protein